MQLSGFMESIVSVIGVRLFGNSVRNSKEAVDTMPRRNPGREGPSHNHLISNIGVNLAAMRDNRPVNVEEEAWKNRSNAPAMTKPCRRAFFLLE